MKKKKVSISYDQLFDTYHNNSSKSQQQPFAVNVSLPDGLDDILISKIVTEPSCEQRILAQFENDKLKRNIKRKKKKLENQKKKEIQQKKHCKIIFEKDLPPSPVETAMFPMKRLPVQEESARFFRKLEKLNETASVHKNMLPAQSSVLRYINNLPKTKQPPWVDNVNSRLIATNKQYPIQQVLSRLYISPNFLRAARNDERPCNHPHCQSVEMGGFKCRELLMPGDKIHPDIHGWCYLCHLFETTRLYIEKLNADPLEYDDTHIYCIHHFIVETDKIGEYRLDKTIQGNANIVSIFGPIPYFNRNNYTKQGNRSWKESDDLLFRLPQKVSNQTEFFPITQQVVVKE